MLTGRQFAWRIVSADLPGAATWWSIFLSWHLVACWFLIRRLTEAFVQPLPSAGLLGCAALVCCVSAALRQLPAKYPPAAGPVTRSVLTWSPSLASLVLISSVTLSGSSLVAVVLAWSMVVSTETFWLSRNIRPGENGRRITETVDWESEALPEGATHQFLRSRQQHGESLTGLLRIDFPPNEPSQIVHIPFYPPFAVAPVIHVTQVTGPTVIVRVTQVESFGVRLDVKYPSPKSAPVSPASPAQRSVVLEVAATTAIDDA